MCLAFHSQFPKKPVRFRFILMASSYSTNSEWQAGPPWTRETPLQALQGLQTLLNSPPAELQAHLPPDSRVWWIQCFRASPKKPAEMTKSLGAIICRVPSWLWIRQGVYVRLWKCATVQPRLDRVYNSTTPTQEGEYYEWHKMAVVNMYIRKTWRAERSLADVDIEPRRRRSPQSSWCTEYTNQSSFIDSLGHWIQFFWWETFHSQRDHWDGPRCAEIYSCQRKDSVSFTSATHLIIAMQFKDNQQMKWVPRLGAVRLTWRCKIFEDYHPLRGVCACVNTPRNTVNDFALMPRRPIHQKTSWRPRVVNYTLNFPILRFHTWSNFH